MADDPDFDADTWLAIRDHAQAKAKEKGADLKGTRRDMLKAGGALGVGALLGSGGYAASTQSAKADADVDDSDGNVGTPSNRVDVFSDGVETNQMSYSPISGATTSINWERPQVLRSDTTIQTSNPQEALRKVPVNLYGNYTIEIDETGDYSAEDWVIPPIQSHDLLDATQGANSRLTITRQGSSGTLNPNSVFIVGGQGAASVTVLHTHPVGVNPYDDEDAVFAVYGGQGIKLTACGIGGTARGSGSLGILSYTSSVKIEASFDFGTDLVETGLEEKQMGLARIDSGVTVSGSVTGNAIKSATGLITHKGNLPTAGASAAVNNVENNATVGTKLFLTDTTGSIKNAFTGRASQIDVGDSLIPDSDGVHDLGTTNSQWNSVQSQSIETDEATIAGREFAESDKTIDVPGDVSWSNLGDVLPIHYQGVVTVNVSGDHSTEEATINPVIEAEDPGGPLIIEGDRDTPSNAKVGGLLTSASVGKRPVLIRGLQFEGVHSLADGNVACQIEGGAGSTVLADVNFNNGQGNGDTCIAVYSGRLLIKGNIDIGSNDYQTFVNAKSHGEVYESAAAAGADITGSVTNYLYRNAGASMFLVDEATTAFSWGSLSYLRGGFTVYNSSSESSQEFSLGDRDVHPTPAYGTYRNSDGGEFSTTTENLISINARGGLVSVVGRGGGNNARFADLVHTCAFNSASVVNSEENANADARNYSVDGRTLELSMSSGTYTVTATTETFDTGVTL